MTNNFNPGFDREKAAFIALANKGEGLTPINYLYAKEASFESILSSMITGGTAELYTIYANNINSVNITNTEDIITNRLKWNNAFNNYYVGFVAGNLTQNTIWRLPLQDGTNGQVLATNGSSILSFIDITSQAAPRDATYIIRTLNANLPEAQVLEELGTGMAKIVSGGAFAIATPGIDYATATQLEEIEFQCQLYADEAAASAEECTASAAESTAAAAEATAAAAEATAAAAEASISAAEAGISAAAAAASALAAGISAGNASSSASDASSSASDASDSASSAASSAANAQNYLNTLLTTGLNALPCNGNVSFQGFRLINLGTPVLGTDGATKSYVDNAVISSGTINLVGDVTGNGQTGNPLTTTLNPLIVRTTNQVFNFTAAGLGSIAFNFDLTIPNSSEKTVKFRMNRANTGNGAGYEFQFYAPIDGIDTFTFGYNSGSQFGIIYSMANNAEVINYNYALNIADSGNYQPYNGGYGYLNSSGDTGTSAGQNSYSINCAHRVKASEFNAVSSKKIKTILGRGQEIESSAIALFKSIPLFKYKYKDTIKEGNESHYGVIAEELAQVAPSFVNMDDEGWIPNVYKHCTAKKEAENIYKLSFDSELESFEGHKLKLIFQKNGKENHIEVNIIEVKEKDLNVFCNESLPISIFAYGIFEKCPTVSKQKVFELGMVVLKNLVTRIEYLENQQGINKIYG